MRSRTWGELALMALVVALIPPVTPVTRPSVVTRATGSLTPSA